MKSISVSKILPQLIATSGVMLLTTQTGLIDGWNSPNIARLSQPNSTIPLTSSESSWLASCTKLGKFASVTFVPFVIERLGTKKAIHCAFAPVAVAWILIMTAESATSLLIARISSGITVGLTWSCYSNYLGEVVSARLRGAFTAAANVGWSLGALLASLGETCLPESISTSIYLAACLLGILMFAWIPDSPYRSAKRGDPTKARESLDWYRGGREATDSELKEILEADARVTFSERLGQLTSPQVRKALALVTFVNVLPQLCGVYNVIYYMQTILANGKASSSLVDPGRTVIYANVVLLASGIAATMIPVAIIWLPETRGKSLREIECVLSGM